jgi:hypothetical protein
MTPVHELFRNLDFEDFHASLLEYEGDFLFDSATMHELGNEYYKKYPDRFSNRNAEEVRLGYTMVRICIIEKVLQGLSLEKKAIYREALSDASRAADAVSKLLGVTERELLAREFEMLQEKLDQIKRDIDELPRGMIRERFTGGITNLFNIMYIFNMQLKKHVQG